MRRAAAGVGMVCLWLAAGCSDTGVLLAIRRGDSAPELERLHVVAGVLIAQNGTTQNFADDDPIDIDVTGHDLVGDPFQLLLVQGGERPPRVMVTVFGFASGGQRAVAFGRLAEPVQVESGKVKRFEMVLEALPSEQATDGDDCQRYQLEGSVVVVGAQGNLDCDPYDAAGGDCDDLDPRIHPGASEVCASKKDDDCDGAIDESGDADGDGYDACADGSINADCDDTDPAMHPTAQEVCDGRDQDCNGLCDDPFDADNDRITTCGTRSFPRDGRGQCGASPQNIADCNDGDNRVSPLKSERCDGLDNDCNGLCDELFDGDGDGFTSAENGADESCSYYRFSRAGVGGCARVAAPDCKPEASGDSPLAFGYCAAANQCVAPLPDVPCFAVDGGLCQAGLATCGGGCVTHGDVLSDAVCNSATTCAGNSNPLQCLHDAFGMGDLLCQVYYDGNGLCGAPSVSLPGTAADGCKWRQIEPDGGPAGYEIQLKNPNGDVNDPLATCDGTIGVASSLIDPPPAHFDSFLARDSGTGVLQRFYRVRVIGTAIDVCANLTLPSFCVFSDGPMATSP